MAGENEGFLESKKQELYSTLHGWYMDSWGCRGLNNDEIDEEFAGLLNDVEEAECTTIIQPCLGYESIEITR